MLQNFTPEVQHLTSDRLGINESSEVSVNTSQEGVAGERSEIESANRVKGFLRRFLAAQCYGKMFSTGRSYSTLGTSLPAANKHLEIFTSANPPSITTAEKTTSSKKEKSYKKHTFAALDHLGTVSAAYLASIRSKVPNLTPDEEGLIEKIENQPWHFRHQSNSALEGAKAGGAQVDISSNDKLVTDSGKCIGHTLAPDRIYLGNQDFVFFGVEFSNDGGNMPLNQQHSSIDYGANSVLIGEENKMASLGYFTLTDQLDNQVPPFAYTQHGSFNQLFPTAARIVGRAVYGDKGHCDVPIYSTKDMKLALGLHAVDFIRKCKDQAFQSFMLNPDINGASLDNGLNAIFQSEFHIPRLLSTRNYTYKKLRSMKLEEAVIAHNFTELDAQITSKDLACLAFAWSKKKKLPEVERYVIRKWKLSQADVPLIEAYLRSNTM